MTTLSYLCINSIYSQGVSYSFVQMSCLHTNKVIVLVMNHTHYILNLTNMYASTDLLEVLNYDEINLYVYS